VRRFFVEFWESARRPAVRRRCGGIALVVGSLLSAVNQGDAILAGRIDGPVLLKIAANFLIPLVVSNLGAMRSEAPSETSPEQ
jgi:hypothetical protein